MATVAATVALHGRRPRLTLDATRATGPAPTVRVMSDSTAGALDSLMRAVVTSGTGTAAAIPGVRVAGTTGSAELRTTPCIPDPADPEACAAEPGDETDTTAWFVGFAPDRRPRVAVGVMLVGAGAGGQTAAPAARTVLLAALGRGLGAD
jgi:cell division protein FtsI/penicillin-binding protein 2